MKKIAFILALLMALALGAFSTDTLSAEKNQEITAKDQSKDPMKTDVVKGKYGSFNTEKLINKNYTRSYGNIEVNICDIYLGEIDFNNTNNISDQIKGKKTVISLNHIIENLSGDNILHQPEKIELRINNKKEPEELWLITKQDGKYKGGDKHVGEISWLVDEDVEEIKTITINLKDSFTGLNNGDIEEIVIEL